MEKAKKNPWWTVLKIVIIIVAIIVFLFVALIVTIRVAFGIDIFKAYSKIKLLGKPIQIEKIVDTPWATSNLTEGLVQLDNVGLSATYTKQGDVVTFDPTTVTSAITMTGDLVLSDKQLAAISNCYMQSVFNSVAVDEDLALDDIQISQVKITDVALVAGGYTSAKVNVVIKIDIKQLKDAINVFPFSIITKHLPEILYINSTNTITMTSDLLYSVTYESLTINNLSSSDSAYIVNLISKFFDIGTLQSLGQDIGKYTAEVLIGNNDAKDGIAYSLKPAGAKAVSFRQESGVGYFVISIENNVG